MTKVYIAIQDKFCLSRKYISMIVIFFLLNRFFLISKINSLDSRLAEF